MGLRRQLTVLGHSAWLLLAAVVFAGGVAFTASGLMPKTYQATATLIVGQSLSAANPDYNELLTSQRLSQTYAQVAATRPVLERVIEKLRLRVTEEELRTRISIATPRDSTLIHIVASDRDPDTAAALANAVADELIAVSPSIQGRVESVQEFVDQELAAVQDKIRSEQETVGRLTAIADRSPEEEVDLRRAESALVTLRSTYAGLLSFSSNSASNLLSVVEPAVPATEPASPRVLLNTVAAALLGMLVAIGVVFLHEHLDDSVRTVDQVDEVTGLATLGAIPRIRSEGKRDAIYRLVALLYPRSPIAEAYRSLRSNIQFAGVDSDVRTLLVTSSVPGEGKTTTASNLAVVFAQAGRRTLLLDADMRKPGIHQMFNLANERGLSDLFLPEARDGGASVSHATEQERLSVVTSGPLPPNPAELLSSHRFRAILDSLREQFDLIVIDSPPVQAVTDAAILGSLTDGTLLVIDAGRTRRGAARQGREALERAGARVLGAVLNRLSQRAQAESYYAYGAYGGYGTGAEPAARPADAVTSPSASIAPAGNRRD